MSCTVKPEHEPVLAAIDGLFALHPSIGHEDAMAILAQAACRFGMVPVGWLDCEFALIRTVAPNADPSKVTITPEASFEAAHAVLKTTGDMLDDGSWESISDFIDSQCAKDLREIGNRHGLKEP